MATIFLTANQRAILDHPAFRNRFINKATIIQEETALAATPGSFLIGEGLGQANLELSTMVEDSRTQQAHVATLVNEDGIESGLKEAPFYIVVSDPQGEIHRFIGFVDDRGFTFINNKGDEIAHSFDFEKSLAMVMKTLGIENAIPLQKKTKSAEPKFQDLTKGLQNIIISHQKELTERVSQIESIFQSSVMQKDTDSGSELKGYLEKAKEILSEIDKLFQNIKNIPPEQLNQAQFAISFKAILDKINQSKIPSSEKISKIARGIALKHTRLLLSQEPNPFMCDNHGQTIIEFVRSFKDPELTKTLESYLAVYEKDVLKKKNPKIISELEKIKKYMTAIRTIKEKGHTLGIFGNFKLQSPLTGANLDVASEGYESHLSITHLSGLLEQFQTTIENQNNFSAFQEVSMSFKNLTDYTRFNGTLSPEEMLRNIKAGEMTFIPGGWKGHDFSLMVYKDYLVVTNRGSGRFSVKGTQIYRLTPKEKTLLTPEYLSSLFDYYATKEDIRKKVKQLIHPKNLLFEIDSKPQKGGSCSLVNMKSSIKAALFLLKYEELLEKLRLAETDKNLKEELQILDIHDSKGAAAYAKKVTKTWYKDFTSWMRNREVDDLIQQCTEKVIPENMLSQFLVLFVNTHLEKPAKNPKKRLVEIERARKLFQSLTPELAKEALTLIPNHYHALFTARPLERPDTPGKTLLFSFLGQKSAEVSAPKPVEAPKTKTEADHQKPKW